VWNSATVRQLSHFIRRTYFNRPSYS